MMVGNLWRESEENRVRLVGKSGKNFPLLSAGGEGHGGISWGVCPAVSLLAHCVPIPSSNWAGRTDNYETKGLGLPIHISSVKGTELVSYML